MKLHVRLFAAARQTIGEDSIEVELGEQSTIADLRQEIAKQWPELTPIVQRAAFAVNEDYASDQTPLADRADVACIPPVSGG